MNVDERRSKHRFDVCQFVDISFMREDFIPVEGLNLSETGFLVKSQRPMDPYTKVFFMITLENETENIRGEGLSIRSEEAEGGGYLVGVQFVELKYTDKQKLRALFENHPGTCE